MKEKLVALIQVLFIILMVVVSVHYHPLAQVDEPAMDEPPEEAQAEEPVYSEDENAGPRFKRVGVLPFKDDTTVLRGGKTATRIFKERLARKFPDTEFKFIELSDEDYSGEPLLLKEAQRIGAKHEVDALIQGYLIGYKVTGGSWPNRAMNYPEVQAVLQVKVVETLEGKIYTKYEYAEKKPKVYPPTIRTGKELFGRVIRDIVDELSEKMKEDKLFYEEEEKG